ncbi:hypothetical protein C8R45DRAFT_942509 [Mycena sanguinolenta]|nr:hypothetical protein C8R45DRAFT_942509 [Mycena sanguinolenta]
MQEWDRMMCTDTQLQSCERSLMGRKKRNATRLQVLAMVVTYWRQISATNADNEVAFVKNMYSMYGVHMTQREKPKPQCIKQQLFIPGRYWALFWKMSFLMVFLDIHSSLKDPRDLFHEGGLSHFPGIDTGSSRPLWSAMATPEGARELIPSQYLPEGLGLRDPSCMVSAEVENIYKLWMYHQKEQKFLLQFKAAEAKRKLNEDQQARLKSLKRKKDMYVEPDDDNEDEEHEEKDIGRGAEKRKRPRTIVPKPHPRLTPETFQARLLELSAFGPYQSLVQEVFQYSKAATSEKLKGRTPAWVSWNIETVELGPDFFDAENFLGYLCNWLAVVDWMKTNPHIPAENSTLSQLQASYLLLIVGLIHHAAKQCAEAEPGSTLFDVPFEFSDLETVETVIQSMLAQSKKGIKFGVAQSIHHSIETAWWKKAFVEAYATLDSMLIRSGKPLQIQAPESFLEVLQSWAQATDLDGNLPVGDATDWQKEMEILWQAIQDMVVPAHRPETVDSIYNQPWCCCGRGGLVCLVLGMKWWRLSLGQAKDKDHLKAWVEMVGKFTEIFRLIGQAKSM